MSKKVNIPVLATFAGLVSMDQEGFNAAARESTIAQWARSTFSNISVSDLGFDDAVNQQIASEIASLTEGSATVWEVRRQFDRNWVFESDILFEDDPIRAGNFLAKSVGRYELGQQKQWKQVHHLAAELIQQLEGLKTTDSAVEFRLMRLNEAMRLIKPLADATSWRN